MMQWVLLRFVQQTPILSPTLSGLRFGFDQAEVAEMSGSFETGSGLLSAQLHDVTISYDLRIAKVSAIKVSDAKLSFAYHAAKPSTATSTDAFGTVAYPLERLQIANLNLTTATEWGVSHFIGQADITRADNQLLQAHLQTTDQTLAIDLSPGFRSAKIVAKQTSGDNIFELEAEHLDQADKQAHLRAEVGPLAQWLNSNALIPEKIRGNISASTQPWITPELASVRLDANLQTADNFATLKAQAFLTRDSRYLARLDATMAKSIINANAKLDMTAMELRGLLQPWQPEVARAWQLTSGQVQATLHLRWQAQRPITGTAHANAFDLALTAGAVQLKQVTVNVDIADLNRPTIALSATLPTLEMGKKLAVRNLAIKATLHDGQLSVEHGGGVMFGGQLSVLPATFDLKHRPLLLTLRLTHVDLAQLLATLDYDKLSGNGTVNGELPLSISEKSIELLDGTLIGTRPGVLRYQGPIADKENLAFRALRNLEYHYLNAKLNYHPNGDYHLDLRLEGSNPEVLSGHALAFNLALSGQLPDLLQKGIMAGNFEQAILKVAKEQPSVKNQTPPLGDHQPKPPAAVRRQQ